MRQKPSQLFRVHELAYGMPRGRHPVMRPMRMMDVGQVGLTDPVIDVCELEIDPGTGYSKICEHRVRFKWQDQYTTQI
jgi:hypothetical protein